MIAAQLSVRRGRSAIEFYKAAFAAVEDYRVGGTDDEPAVVAQLSVGKTSFWVADESPPHDNFSPESLGGSTTRLLLIAEDPQANVVATCQFTPAASSAVGGAASDCFTLGGDACRTGVCLKDGPATCFTGCSSSGTPSLR